MSSREKTKADIKSLENIASQLKGVFKRYKFRDDLTGEEIILSGLPLPVGCKKASDVQKDELYRVSYSAWMPVNHFKNLKKLYRIKDPVKRKRKILEYVEKNKIKES